MSFGWVAALPIELLGQPVSQNELLTCSVEFFYPARSAFTGGFSFHLGNASCNGFLLRHLGNIASVKRQGNSKGKRGAARNNSGLPVDDSGPGLRVGPTTPATSDRTSGACPPNTLSQHKSRRGTGGGAPSASEASIVLRSEATQQGSSLVEVQINRNSKTYDSVFCRAPVGRGKHCGKWTVSAVSLDRKRRFIRVDCRCWDCAYCGPRKATRYRYAIRDTAERYGLNRFVTLTLDPAELGGEPAVPYINATFAKWRIYLKRKFGVSITYIRILEFQQNGNPHFHILVDRFMPQAWIKSTWQAVGGGRLVDIRFVDIHRIAHYLSKYLTKALLLSAPKRSRRITVSRGIQLLEKKKSDLVWYLFKKTIFNLFFFRLSAIGFTFQQSPEI